jgi:hypothetical protein
MPTRKKHIKKNTKKRRRLNRKTNKKLRRTNKKLRKTRRKIYFGGNGATWLVSSELEDKDKDEKCSICLDEFKTTPNKVIYKTVCGHLYHNDCLEELCEKKNREYLDTRNREKLPRCPMCREFLDIDDGECQCIDVEFFKAKLLHPTTENNLSEEVRKLYDAQPDPEPPVRVSGVVPPAERSV